MTKGVKKAKGTYIELLGGGKVCPRCEIKAYGFTSKSEVYDDDNELVKTYKMDKQFCRDCAYVEGDSL